MPDLNASAPQCTTASDASIQSFRNVSACNRCRLRKHRCDQRLPRCEPCEKAGTRCVGYDPLTKREVPRSYVCFLESQVKYLKQILVDHGIEFKLPMSFGEKEVSRCDFPRQSLQRRDILSPSARLEDNHEVRQETPSLKRKLSPSAESNLPPRQLKRVLQLNLILKDLLLDSLASSTCDREHVQPALQTPVSTQSMQGISIPQETCSTPELSAGHTSSESYLGSPASQRHFEKSPSMHHLPVSHDVHDFKGPNTPESHFSSDTGQNFNSHGIGPTPLGHISSPNAAAGYSSSPLQTTPGTSYQNGLDFTFPSILNQSTNEQSTHDFLDEFLVSWDEDRLGIN